MMDYCKGQMRVHAKTKNVRTLAGVVKVYVFRCPVCDQEYERRQPKEIHIVLKCSEMAREREEIAA